KENMVRHVSMASRVPSDSLNNEGALMPEGRNEWIQLPFVHVYYDYFETLGINASQGRLFSSRLQTDAEQAVVLNRSALKKLEIQGDPIGRTVACAWPKSNRKIIGVIDDFHFESLYEPIRPAVFVIAPEECSRLLIKTIPSDPGQTINRLTEICNRFYPGSIFDFQFMDTRLQSIYQKDINSFRLMESFTALAILIACMGLFGLAIFMMRRRTKEIAVRKVLGASIRQILQLLTKDVARWVIIANLVAWPVAWYAVARWLGNFAYHINITILPFLLSGIASLAIAMLTVGIQAWKAAAANPVESLKYE
ncbi:MAG: FtsX-like permease family protein, partial [Deltaproteobacteria bacterium]|nr:FtsX-like permease family protein [Deltaproteobacteria bacterium]